MDYYNKHYIRVDAQGLITCGFSDAFRQPQDGDTCINEQGSYQFRLGLGGKENSPLIDDNGAHLYRWDGAVIPTTPEERAAEVSALPPPPPDPLDELWQAVTEGEIINIEQDIAITDLEIMVLEGGA